MSEKESISKDYIFTLKNNKLSFIGDFDGLYLDDNNPWGQNGCDNRLNKYYLYSRNNIINTLKENNQNNQNLLEIGSGLGYVVDYFSKQLKYNCSGFDISNIAVTKAKKNFPEYNFYCFDITSKNIEHNKKYDVIILNQVLWYVLENFNNVFENIYKLLNERGYFLIVNAFTDNQNYGKDIVNGFGGLLTYIEENQKDKFEIKKANLYKDDHLLYKDGLILLSKKLKYSNE